VFENFIRFLEAQQLATDILISPPVLTSLPNLYSIYGSPAPAPPESNLHQSLVRISPSTKTFNDVQQWVQYPFRAMFQVFLKP
jgi:hypothetical protein